ncbi:hypothetical protein BZG02_10885 [Labilibaculum filiforme]|uniref:Radical SAM core domain-containing protein n=1 Tax=Labilibaculum filiforme TaxID=1940526 RepID=A0A2N3HXB7_9BACT|nr:radical SAM protein [Labilibaculum filiforme]PKQ62710.1 hypothetical protein BZG02_10885 [Labilibaculum filiforme]
MLEKIIIFNPYYHIHHDINRAFILNDNFFQIDNEVAKSEFHTLIHPIQASFLSFFDGEHKLSEILPKIANFLRISEEEALEKVNMFYYNQEINVEYDNHVFGLPPNLLIEKSNVPRKTKYNPSDFLMTKNFLDLKQNRFNKPNNFTIVINNICYTNCKYCYADKKEARQCQLSSMQFGKIISDAHQLGIKQIDITGGELFLYKEWYELLTELKNYNYFPYISTKVPINEQQIIKLKGLGYDFIQFSLDSADPLTLTDLLDVDENYISKVKETLSNLQKHGFKVTINTVLTNKNSDRNQLNQLINFLNKYENVKEVQFAVMGYSINMTYENYMDYKMKKSKLAELDKIVDELQSVYSKKKIAIAGFSEEKEYVASVSEKTKSFNERAMCSGNFNSFIMLPNGDVTICEELYFRENFIMGNLLENTIDEVWNSDKAKNLFYLKNLFENSHSICKECSIIDECRISGLGVCWTEIIGAYGENNLSYPDPRCPHAPTFNKEVYY